MYLKNINNLKLSLMSVYHLKIHIKKSDINFFAHIKKKKNSSLKQLCSKKKSKQNNDYRKKLLLLLILYKLKKLIHKRKKLRLKHKNTSKSTKLNFKILKKNLGLVKLRIKNKLRKPKSSKKKKKITILKSIFFILKKMKKKKIVRIYLQARLETKNKNDNPTNHLKTKKNTINLNLYQQWAKKILFLDYFLLPLVKKTTKATMYKNYKLIKLNFFKKKKLKALKTFKKRLKKKIIKKKTKLYRYFFLNSKLRSKKLYPRSLVVFNLRSNLLSYTKKRRIKSKVSYFNFIKKNFSTNKKKTCKHLNRLSIKKFLLDNKKPSYLVYNNKNRASRLKTSIKFIFYQLSKKKKKNN